MVWVVRNDFQGGKEYLWSPRFDVQFTLGEWNGDQKGAWRFSDRSEAHRQATKAKVHGRSGAKVVRLLPKRKKS